MITQGTVAPGFERVAEAFAANFEEGLELGAGLAVVVEGEPVVELWGGFKDRGQTEAWTRDTIVPVYSATKGAAALVVAKLVSEGKLDYEAPVASVWPEFAAHGKDRLTLAQLLSHQAGLPGFKDPIDPALWLDPAACAAALAAMAPLWPPGTASGYHPLTWGYLVGEIVRRASGRTLGAILQEDFCEPSAIDFWIGLPESEDERVAKIARPPRLPELGEITELKTIAFLSAWAAPDRGGPEWRRIEIPSANGHCNAPGLAWLYDCYAERGSLDGEELISASAFAALTKTRVDGDNLVLPGRVAFAAGPQLNHDLLYGPEPEALLHPGWGGSVGLADPKRRLAIGYVLNKQSPVLRGDPRAVRLVNAIYASI